MHRSMLLLQFTYLVKKAESTRNKNTEPDIELIKKTTTEGLQHSARLSKTTTTTTTKTSDPETKEKDQSVAKKK